MLSNRDAPGIRQRFGLPSEQNREGLKVERRGRGVLCPPLTNNHWGRQTAWRKIVGLAASNGIAAPAFMSALAYYDGYRAPRLPANLLQAQRDYFGAHTYERIDAPRGKFFHTNWTGKGGTVSAGTYTV